MYYSYKILPDFSRSIFISFHYKKKLYLYRHSDSIDILPRFFQEILDFIIRTLIQSSEMRGIFWQKGSKTCKKKKNNCYTQKVIYFLTITIMTNPKNIETSPAVVSGRIESPTELNEGQKFLAETLARLNAVNGTAFSKNTGLGNHLTYTTPD